jgi:hypothetical protein
MSPRGGTQGKDISITRGTAELRQPPRKTSTAPSPHEPSARKHSEPTRRCGSPIGGRAGKRVFPCALRLRVEGIALTRDGSTRGQQLLFATAGGGRSRSVSPRGRAPWRRRLGPFAWITVLAMIHQVQDHSRVVLQMALAPCWPPRRHGRRLVVARHGPTCRAKSAATPPAEMVTMCPRLAHPRLRGH